MAVAKGVDVARFAADLDGVTFTSHGARLLGGLYKAAGDSPLRQWTVLPPLWEAIEGLGPRPVLLVAAGNDAIFPKAAYAARIAAQAHVRCIERVGSDHGFSSCRSWLVTTVCDWLVATLGR